MNHHDADRLLALLSGQPVATVEKVEELIAESQAAHAAYSAASDAAQESWATWNESQRARLNNRAVTVTMTDSGPEYADPDDPDAAWLKPVAAELRRKWRDWKRLRDAADRLAGLAKRTTA